MRAVREALARAARVLVMSHRDPDGDALGACLGLTWLLRPQGREVRVHSAGPIPEEYRFLPGIELVSAELPAPAEVDLVVLLDCHQPSRTAKPARPSWRLARGGGGWWTITGDHGVRSPGAWLAPEYAATARCWRPWPGGRLAPGRQGRRLPVRGLADRYRLLPLPERHRRGLRMRGPGWSGRGPRPGPSARRSTPPAPSAWRSWPDHGRPGIPGRRPPGGGPGQPADLAAAEADHRDLEDAVETLRGIPGVEVAVLLGSAPAVGQGQPARPGRLRRGPGRDLPGGGRPQERGGLLEPRRAPRSAGARLVEIIAPAWTAGSEPQTTPSFLADGVLLVDKPVGPSSHQVLARLKRCFSPAKLGHTGTLDPFASGLLLVLVNRATRLSEFLGAGEKLYQATLALGRATDTGDLTGRTVAEAPVPPLTPARVAEALAELVGERMQAPPAYSAASTRGGRSMPTPARASRWPSHPGPSGSARPASWPWRGTGGVPGGLLPGTYVRRPGEDLARHWAARDIWRRSGGWFGSLRGGGGPGPGGSPGPFPAELAARLMPPAVALLGLACRAVLPQEPIRRLRQGQAWKGSSWPPAARGGPRSRPVPGPLPRGDLVAVLPG